MGFRLGLCSISFRENTPEEIAAAMHEAGVSVIEWGSDVHCPPQKAGTIAALQRRYGITCSSYGTYFRLGVTPLSELKQYIIAALRLDTRCLRVWCSDKNAEEHTADEKKALFDDCKAAARLAKLAGVMLCVECHAGTYTNTKESALELMQEVNSTHFRMYWQPDPYRSELENIVSAAALSPYTVNLHVFHWQGAQRYPLQLARERWKRYLTCFHGEHTLLLEFMPDDNIASLKAEAEALKEIVG